MSTNTPIIVLTTDFGLSDPFVGIMRGAILRIARNAVVVDLSHNVPPQDVAKAAFVIGTAWRYFPVDAIHVVVVDPGVGSDRPILAVSTAGGVFLAPDNGALSYVLRDHSPDLPPTGGPVATAALGPSVATVLVTEHTFWLPRIGSTFHGRDVFAPVAAHLANGLPIQRLGPPARSVTMLPLSRPERIDQHTWLAHVLHVDHFGNLITDLTAKQAKAIGAVRFLVADQTILGLSSSYSEGPPLSAIVGSSGFVEISVRNGSAAANLGAGVGAAVRVVAEGFK